MTASELAPLVRIAIRYAIPALSLSPMASSILGTVADDPQLLQIASAAILVAANEAWYVIAKRNGGAT